MKREKEDMPLGQKQELPTEEEKIMAEVSSHSLSGGGRAAAEAVHTSFTGWM